MPEYRVDWGIEIYADTEQEAAEMALEYMRDHTAQVGKFTVTNNKVEGAESVEIDLTPDEQQ